MLKYRSPSLDSTLSIDGRRLCDSVCNRELSGVLSRLLRSRDVDRECRPRLSPRREREGGSVLVLLLVLFDNMAITLSTVMFFW